MRRVGVAVLVADLILVVAELLAIQDQLWRSSYAASFQGGMEGYAPSVSYNVLTRLFTMSGNGVSLASPLTLDWAQVIPIILLVINAWFGYTTLSSRGALKSTPMASNL